ncbi:MAG: sigma-70 family RNA polymerase sigma factor [Verrucomicrobia bacterium]|nr:sigma-70 family RNA polymerase sigma factor [Verrucomicrobiota bacterium]
MQAGRSHAVFATTRWSLVQAAGDGVSPEAVAALNTLANTYWYPLYAFARRSGCTPNDAEDLTQGYFARLIDRNGLGDVRSDRGRFRGFLLASFKHFMADEWKKGRRQKRGGGVEQISLDAGEAEDRYGLEPVEIRDAERLFQRRWAMTILDRALGRLEAEFVASERSRVFHELRPFLVGDSTGTYAEAARALNTSEAAIKMTVSRLRQRARVIIRDEIAQTVSTPAEVDEEFRALLEALRS